MGVLKVRVGGAWQSLGLAPGLPTGGVLGDVLAKNSSTNGDASWSASIPKLSLTSVVDATLASTTHALTAGAVAALNVAVYRSGIQARSNGVKSLLRLNYYGGDVEFGGGDAGQYAGSFKINEAIHATSRRANFQLGSNWQVLQDINVNGIKDLSIYSISAPRVGLHIAAAGDMVTVTQLKVAPTPAGTGPRIYTDGSFAVFTTPTDMNLDGSTIFLRDVAGTERARMNDTGLGLRGTRSFNFVDMGGGWYMADTSWIRAVSNKGIYTGGEIRCLNFTHSGTGYKLTHETDTDTGYYYVADGNFQLRSNTYVRMEVTGTNTWIKCDGFTTPTTKNWSYAQLVLQNVNAAAGVSLAGLAANPGNAGSAPIWQNVGGAGDVWSASNSGNTGYIPIAASAFNVGSSLRFKTDVDELDDRGVLDRVRDVKLIRYRERIRPQNIDQDADGNFLLEGSHDHDCDIDPCDGTSDDPCCIALNDKERLGVSAEALWESLPEAVYLGVDREPETVNVGTVATLALAGVAALLRRIEQLEGKKK